MKKALSILLVLIMVAAMLPLGAFAADPQAEDSNGVKYDTLKEAFDLAANGATITLLQDIETANTHNIGSETDQTRELTLNLNGHTIKGVDAKASGNHEVFYNFGTFTIIDSVGGGKITLKAQHDRNWDALSAIVHNRGGVFNLYGGTLEHKGGTDMAYALDNSGNSYGDATANIYGGELISTYVGIRNRMEQNPHGASGTTYLYINGGSVTGVSRAIWGQVASVSENPAYYATGSIEITGGTINGRIQNAPKKNTAGEVASETSLKISGGTVNGNIETQNDELEITGGTFTGALDLYDNAGDDATSANAVSGGTFTNPDFDPTPYLVPDMTVDPETGTVVLVHVHAPKVEWEMDAAAHWHCCQGCGEICTEFGSHYDNNKDGRCDDCGWYLADSVNVGRENPSTGVKAGGANR